MSGSRSAPTGALVSHDARNAIAQSVALAIACLISFELAALVLAHVHAVSGVDSVLGAVQP